MEHRRDSYDSSGAHSADRLQGSSQQLRLNRRSALRRFAVAGISLLACRARRPLSANAQDTMPAGPNATQEIAQLRGWPIGAYPNYCDSAIVGQQHYVWVACFNDAGITRVDVLTGDTDRFATGDATRPLDVAYDAKRDRVAVASADDAGTLIVLDGQGRIVGRRELAYGTEQGLSTGGAQGVAVDAEGDYWISLAYDGMDGMGVVTKVSGATLEPVLNIKNVDLYNPNGVICVDDSSSVFVLSNNGVAHEFGTDGSLRRTLKTVQTGYRGAAKHGTLWVGSWSQKGELARVSLKTGQRDIFPCVPLANSVVIDPHDRVWVAGDAGVSVSDISGFLLAVSSTDSYANGLTSVGGDTFHVTQLHDSGWLKRLALVNARIRLPGIFSSQAGVVG